MKYEINFNNETLELPNFNFKIAEELDKIDDIDGLKNKCKAIYDFLVNEIFDRETVEGVLGKFSDADPNDIQLLFFCISNAYDKPMSDSTLNYVAERIEESGIERVANIIDKVSKLPQGKKRR